MTSFHINGRAVTVDAEDDTPLLWVIRDVIGLTGTKFGCGIGMCGACTVHVGGRPTRSCITPLTSVAGAKVTTIEGLDPEGKHPVQQAWADLQVPQCGYCQSGQIMQAVSLIKDFPSPTDQDIDAVMAGNLCRCMTYVRIRNAASLPYQPGGATNLYIENNTFTGTGSLGIAATDTGYSGARIVFRHNTLMNATMYSHWTSKGSVNSLWWEIYNNKFTWTLGQGMYPFRLQGGGTGLIYNNTFVGFPSNLIAIGEGRLGGQSAAPLNYCDGTNNWDGNAGDAAAPGWPCLAQTGRNAGKSIAQIQAGNKEASFPLYIWNNGPQDSCYNPSLGGPACDNSFGVGAGGQAAYFKSTPHVTAGYGNGDVDYSITTSQPSGAGTHTLTYTPYTYPHPMALQP
jgi:isoquinoline 1-oxidoreductase subunit alpha